MSMPHQRLFNRSVERVILSSFIFQPELIEDSSSELKADDFYIPFHKDLFKTILHIHKTKKIINEDFLKHDLEKKNKFLEDEFLNILMEPPVSKIEFYIKELKSRSVKRELINLAKEIENAVFEQDMDSMELLNFVETKVYAIGQESSTGGFKNSNEILDLTEEYIKEMQKRENKDLTGITTGFRSLNKMTTGFNEGDLVILAARPAMGKCLALNTNVVMIDGSLKKVENVKVGESLMGDDSTPRKVLSITTGREKMYWIRQDQGIDYRVNESHILSLKRSENEGKHKYGDVLNISVAEYIKKSDHFKTNHKGYKVAIEFEHQSITDNPYFLGKTLNADQIIPQNYLINSRKIRLELLAGLIDSIGKYNRDVRGFEILQNSEKSAKQIKFLCDSLGFRTSIKYLENQKEFKIRCFGDIEKVPVQIQENMANSWNGNLSWHLTNIRVEEDIVDDYYGFTLDGNNLFLLEDATVTHNTALALNIVNSSLKNGDGVAFFSLEMPVEQLMLRLLSIDSYIELQKLRTGDLSEDHLRRLYETVQRFRNYNLFIDDDGGININTLRTKLRKLKAKNPKVNLAIIDYIQIMSSSGSKDRQAEVSEISRGLKLLARELKMPILALSQLNRSLESRNDKRPIMSDIRESGAIEQDADIILFVYRDDIYRIKAEKEKEKEARSKGEKYVFQEEEKPEEIAEIIIGKQRNGPTGVVKLNFIKNLTKFVDVSDENGSHDMDENQTITRINMGIEDNFAMPKI